MTTWSALAARYQQGGNIRQVGREHGLGYRRARRELVAAGVRIRSRSEQPRRAYPLTWDQAADLYRAGWTCTEIAQQLGCAFSTVNRNLIDHGVTMRRPGGGRRRDRTNAGAG